VNWLQKIATYSNELAYLNRYLREAWDPYDYIYHVKRFLEYNDRIPSNEDDDEYEIGSEWLEKATPEELEEFKKFVEKVVRNEPRYDLINPPYEDMEYNKFIKPTWLIHFTDEPWEIERHGFIYGHEGTEGLHLTTYKSEEQRHKGTGYNFAFQAETKYANRAAMRSSYGRHAVVFWGAGVQVFHYGDEENQVIFDGSTIDKNMIFPIFREGYGNGWEVSDGTGRIMKKGEFEDVVSWVINNWERLLRTKEKHLKL